MIKHIFQPKRSNMCGQACVAMVLGFPLLTVRLKMGRRATSGKDLHNALSEFFIDSSPQQVRLSGFQRVSRWKPFFYENLPARCIAKCRSTGVRASHWILVWDGKIYDPYPGGVAWQYVSGYVEIKQGERS